MTMVRVPSWGLSLTEARYYGWRWCLHIGPWLVFFGVTRAGAEAAGVLGRVRKEDLGL